MDNSPDTAKEIEMQEAERKATISALTVVICIMMCGFLLIGAIVSRLWQ